MSGKRKRSSGDGGVLDAHNAMNKALAYKPPDEIFMTGKLNSFIKVSMFDQLICLYYRNVAGKGQESRCNTNHGVA